MADRLNIQKKAVMLNGKERARLIIKDEHAERCGKAGFLNKAEQEALWWIENPDTLAEFIECRKIYAQTPEVWLCLITEYHKFLISYGKLNAVRYMIATSRGLRIATDIIKDSMADSTKAEQAMGLLEVMQPIQVKEQGLDGKPDRLIIKDPFTGFVKQTVSEIYATGCDIYALIAVSNKIIEEVGLNAFQPLEKGLTLQSIRTDIINLIENHNSVIYQTIEDGCRNEATEGQGDYQEHYKELENLEDYLIQEPIVNTQLYAEWDNKNKEV